MRAVLIDARARTVTEIDIDGSLESVQRHVGGYFDVAGKLPSGDILYVPEDGSGFFMLGREGPYQGPAVVTGPQTEEMDITAVILRLEWFLAHVSFGG
jgi:hypothetical protein